MFAYKLKKKFRRNVFGRITKATMVHPNFKLDWTHKPYQRYWQFFILEDYGHAGHAWPHTRKLRDQTAASIDILLHVKSKLSTSNNFWDIKTLKNMQSDWSRLFSITTKRLDFSQPWVLYRLSKVVYHLKPKNHNDGPNLSSKSVSLIFFRELRACLSKSEEDYMMKL